MNTTIQVMMNPGGKTAVAEGGLQEVDHGLRFRKRGSTHR